MTFINNVLVYLFDANGMHLIQWYLIILIIDVVIGSINSIVKSKFKSRSYLYGILRKFGAILLIPLANMLDDLFLNYMNISLGIDISDAYTMAVLLYEASSIVENFKMMGVFTGNLSNLIDKAKTFLKNSEKDDNNNGKSSK
ncbi:phage holin family protein [Apilactobacillus xinyiensis]|uniref:phage holin family protein n=1 Tax=Apilactobacillus xinyiensis TaxID=2841032 RepID=UPI00200C939D|nr:phage holin family protein [Apilactobacillus xinyiensis]MCL0330627.1 phage holin family protein [Apilactobacillus xinyiensis]